MTQLETLFIFPKKYLSFLKKTTREEYTSALVLKKEKKLVDIAKKTLGVKPLMYGE